jgi:glycerate-2-kinase
MKSASPRGGSQSDIREVLVDLYRSAVGAVEPTAAMRRAFVEAPPPAADRVWIIASGKASAGMARAAVDQLAAGSTPLAGGVLVTPETAASPHPAIRVYPAEHPLPGPGSMAAALAVEALLPTIRPGDEAWVLLSGGSTSLLAAPVGGSGIGQEDLATLYQSLIEWGLDIGAMNLVRKRVSRWGAGRLATALGLAGARTRAYVLSDVITDDLAAIGSGPCVGDPATAQEVRSLLMHARLWPTVPESIQRYLRAVIAGAEPETPKPDDPTFERVMSRIIATNADALDAAEARARESGFRVARIHESLRGEAALAGAQFADGLTVAIPPHEDSGTPRCMIQGGETTVTLTGRRASGLGGRCQEFALAAARRLSELGASGRAWWLLAAGSDGRDGPTDAAGAIISGSTWQAIGNAGRSPSRDLEGHDAYQSLDAVGALFKPGPTGTNVMDIVIALERPEHRVAAG